MVMLYNAARKDDNINLEENQHLILTKSHMHKAKTNQLTQISSKELPNTNAGGTQELWIGKN
jgi:hypothetical protein